jgi:hypothetical protein
VVRTDQYKRSLFLYAALPQSQLAAIIRGQCIPEELENLDQIVESWRKSASILREIEVKESGAADESTASPIDAKYSGKLDKIRSNVLFKTSFSTYPSEFRLVDIDKLIAVQRNVDLNYVEQLTQRVSKNIDMEQLIDFCLSPSQDVPSPQSLQLQPNLMTYSSPSKDFRFLGGYPKKMTADDLQYAIGGGLPVAALILFVGYGAGSVNVLQARNRLILNNGFHRVYTLRKLGVEQIPVVVQQIGNPDLEMPLELYGLSREYLLTHSRPILCRDFLTDALTVTLRLKNTIRSVRVQWAFEQTDMAMT